MKVDFSQVLKDFDGEELKTIKGEQPFICSKCGQVETKPKETPMTLGLVCARALGNSYSRDDMNPEERIQRFDLGIAIMAAKKPLEISDVYLEILRKVIPMGYPGPLVSGQALKMLATKDLVAPLLVDK